MSDSDVSFSPVDGINILFKCPSDCKQLFTIIDQIYEGGDGIGLGRMEFRDITPPNQLIVYNIPSDLFVN